MNNKALSKEQFFEMRKTFKAFVKDRSNHPRKDATYGSKIGGNVMFKHFVAYAVLRGKDPALTTHDVESESYQDVLRDLRRYSEGGSDWELERFLLAFGLDFETISFALRDNL